MPSMIEYIFESRTDKAQSAVQWVSVSPQVRYLVLTRCKLKHSSANERFSKPASQVSAHEAKERVKSHTHTDTDTPTPAFEPAHFDHTLCALSFSLTPTPFVDTFLAVTSFLLDDHRSTLPSFLLNPPSPSSTSSSPRSHHVSRFGCLTLVGWARRVGRSSVYLGTSFFFLIARIAPSRLAAVGSLESPSIDRSVRTDSATSYQQNTLHPGSIAAPQSAPCPTFASNSSRAQLPQLCSVTISDQC